MSHITSIREAGLLCFKHIVNCMQSHPFLISGRREEKRSGAAGGRGVTEFERKLPVGVEPKLQ